MYRVEYIKKVENNLGKHSNNEIYYRVVFKSKNKYLLILFDENGNKIYSLMQSFSSYKDKFNFVKVNETKQSQVYFTMWGKGKYVHFASINDIEPKKISIHLTTDGYLIIIAYNKDKIVTSISCELI